MAEIMKTDVAFQHDAACAMRDAFKPKVGSTEGAEGGSSTEQFLEELRADEEFRCEFYGEVRSAVKDTFDAIVAQKRIPNVVYAFTIYEPCCEDAGQDAFGEQEIGLFLELAECERFEAVMRERVVGTRKCAVWKDPLAGAKAASN
jgi:hypothetical protein